MLQARMEQQEAESVCSYFDFPLHIVRQSLFHFLLHVNLTLVHLQPSSPLEIEFAVYLPIC
jgi:hypothetical protein